VENFFLMLGGLFIGVLVFIFLIFLVSYIFISLAFMAMGKKAKLNHPGLAWIPVFGPLVIAFQASDMHWWPWLLLIGSAFFYIEIAVLQFISFAAYLVFFVYSVVWDWKLLEAINKPGWWAILFLIPFVNFIFMGIAAWSKDAGSE
jgi:hypothetical protein